MENNTIKLNKSDVLTLKIQTAEGKDTGEVLEFDLSDIEIPLKYQELLEKDKKNKENIKNQLLIIDKRQDVKGKKLLSRNEEDKIKAIKDFFDKEVEIYNIFLGENGVQKLLNGRKLGWTTLQEIDEIIDKQIAPHINVNMETITNKIKNKYSKVSKKDQIEVIE
jgi:hypothetical protein